MGRIGYEAAMTKRSIGIYEKALPEAMSWEARLEKAAQLDYDYVEISIDESEARLGRLHWSHSERAKLRSAVAETGVPIRTMCLSGHRQYPLGSGSAATREQALDILQRAIAFAADIGVRIVQVMGYDVFYEPSDTESAGRFFEGLQQGVHWAADAGVMLALENVDREFLDSVAKGMDLVERLNSPWLQLYPDMGNLVAAGYEPVSQFRLGQGHIVAVHVKDALPGVVRGVPFGEGDVSFAAVFSELAQLGYCGPLTVEMWADRSEANPVDTARKARAFVAFHVQKACSHSVPGFQVRPLLRGDRGDI